MGYEVPAALGAQLGRPDKTVWSIAGDGGFQMTLMELATMVENHVPVKIAIMNNQCLGMVVQWQRLFYQNSFVATKYTGNPDFVKLAEAYGIPACRVSEKDSVAEAITWAMETEGPVLVDFWIDSEQDVYPMIPSGMSVAELMEDPKLNRDRVK